MTHGGYDDDLDEVRRRAANFSIADLEALYRRNGFLIRPGRRHAIAVHTRFPQIRSTLPNPHHGGFAKSYVLEAAKLIQRARDLGRGQAMEGDERHE